MLATYNDFVNSLKKVFMKRFIVIVLACIMCMGFAHAENRIIKVGVELNSPPFEFEGDNGEPAGVSIDFIRDFANFAEIEIEILALSEDSLMPSIQTGKVDLLISSIPISERRAEIVDFSNPYAEDAFALFVGPESQLSHYEDVNTMGASIAVLSKCPALLYAKDKFHKAEVIEFASEEDAVKEVLDGKVDAYISEQLDVYRLYTYNPDTSHVIATPAKDAIPWGVAFRKGNEDLLERMNEFIAEYTISGGYEVLSEKYLELEKLNFEQLGLHWYFPEDKE